MLPLQRVDAQRAADMTPPVASTQADEQITSLLRQTELLLDKGHVTSPAGGNASEVFTRALLLSSSASPTGQRMMAEFPSALKSRADAERAAGHGDLSAQIAVFAEVVSSVIHSNDAPSAQSGAATITDGTTDPAPRKAAAMATQASQTMPRLGAVDQAAPPVKGETSHRETDASLSKAITDARSPRPVPPISSNSLAQHSPPVGETGPLASSGGRGNVETVRESGSSQVAALPPAAAAPAASPFGVAATPEPARVAPPLTAMADALLKLRLLKQGKAMLSIGDISAARLLFTRAAESGNGEAALALGDTYNPAFLAEHSVVGSQADPELAKRWYRKAFAFGDPRARERLAGIGGDAHAEAQGSVNTQ